MAPSSVREGSDTSSFKSVEHDEKSTPSSQSAVSLPQEANLKDPEAGGATPQPQLDSGFLPWSQVVAGHLVALNTWGYITSYGLFQAFYTKALNEQPSAISWVGSIQVFLTFFISTFSMHALNKGFYRPTLALGLGLQVIGVFCTSVSYRYWQFLLAQGVCQGIGAGLTFAPTVGLVSSYFVRRRAVAIAGMASGMSTGGVVFPVIGQQLLDRIGFAWTLRVMGFVILANSVVILLLVRPRPAAGGSHPLIDRTALRDPCYMLFAVGMVLAVMAMYFGYYYVTSFAEDVLKASPSTSLSLLLAMNAVGLPGRFIPAYFADRRLGPTNTLVLMILVSGAVVYGWAGVRDIPGTWAFAVLYGFFGASIQSLFPPAVAFLTRDSKLISVRVGMMFSIISIGCLTGPPIAGALIQAQAGRYLLAQVVLGSVLVVATTITAAARVAHTGRVLWAKC